VQLHADIICAGGGDVLNVGFGLGIIDEAIQRRGPRSHTIVEAHPDVYQHMLRQGWGERAGVRVVFGRWQDVVASLGPFDGVFFDTYGEYYEELRDFQAHLPRLLRPGGVYSFFNGLAPDNLFFHMVSSPAARRRSGAPTAASCPRAVLAGALLPASRDFSSLTLPPPRVQVYGEIARRELNALGMSVKYAAVPMDASADSIWEGVRNRYWHLKMYFVPTCVMEPKAALLKGPNTEGEAAPAANDPPPNS
jgi:protein arginine N-methyltransferase 2